MLTGYIWRGFLSCCYLTPVFITTSTALPLFFMFCNDLICLARAAMRGKAMKLTHNYVYGRIAMNKLVAKGWCM
jgi:hypothetical protein